MFQLVAQKTLAYAKDSGSAVGEVVNLIPRAASPTTSGSAHSQGTVNLMPHAATPSITRSPLSQERVWNSLI